MQKYVQCVATHRLHMRVLTMWLHMLDYICMDHINIVSWIWTVSNFISSLIICILN